MSKRPTRLTLLRVASALLVISAVGAIAAYTLNRPAVPVADRAWPKLEQATGVDADQIPLLLKQAAGIDADRTSLKLEQATGIDAPPALLRDFNVLLITMDTTRADHLHAYGHTGVKTPHLDSLAQGGSLLARNHALTVNPSRAQLDSHRALPLSSRRARERHLSPHR